MSLPDISTLREILQYQTRLDWLNDEIYTGNPESWNEEYLIKLDKHGLRLAEAEDVAEDDRQIFIRGPWPSPSDPPAWSRNVFIVPKYYEAGRDR